MPALELALRGIDERGIDDVYCGGDPVGYGPRPNEICRTIQERRIPTIYGNYDYAIDRDFDDCGCFYPTPRDREIGQGSGAWTLEHTDERWKQFMLDLPFDLRFELAGKGVRLVHGSPRKVNEYRARRSAGQLVRADRAARGLRVGAKTRTPPSKGADLQAEPS